MEIENILYEEILPEMFRRVSCITDDIKTFTQNENWYWLYEWTKNDEDDFIVWLSDYFKTNKKAFSLIGKSYIKNNKENRMRLATNFVANYGWKVKKEA